MNGDTRPVLCPSAQPDMPDAVAFGVVDGTADEPRVAWIERPVPVSDQLLALAKPVRPTQVMRFAATCQERDCVHFDGVNCRLATRIVANLPVVTEDLPACHVRRDCRWFHQEGGAACRRCPQIVTLCASPSELMDRTAMPETGAG